jgi:hypothetical protein
MEVSDATDKIPSDTTGIDPGTFRLVAWCLNQYATHTHTHTHTNIYIFYLFIYLFIYVNKNKVEGKAIPLQASTGAERSRRLRLPGLKIIGTLMW